jgi:uncharacterized glyoxalase superfamily protein PhnB
MTETTSTTSTPSTPSPSAAAQQSDHVEPAGPAPAVWHSLTYDDAPAAITFLTTTLGFVATAVYPEDDPTQIGHAQLDWPEGGGIMLGSRQREGWPDIRGHGSAYVVTDDPAAVYARVVAAGCRVLRDLRDEDYGGSGFVMLDPEGNMWSFGSYRGESARA